MSNHGFRNAKPAAGKTSSRQTQVTSDRMRWATTGLQNARAPAQRDTSKAILAQQLKCAEQSVWSCMCSSKGTWTRPLKWQNLLTKQSGNAVLTVPNPHKSHLDTAVRLVQSLGRKSKWLSSKFLPSTSLLLTVYTLTSLLIASEGGDESQPPNNCSVAKSTRRHTFVCFLYTRGPLHVSPAEPDLLSDHLARSRIEYPCQNCTAMGCIWAGWAAESLAHCPGHLKVPQVHRAMTLPLPEAELNSHATIEWLWVVPGLGLKPIEAPIRFKHDCSIARSRIEQPWKKDRCRTIDWGRWEGGKTMKNG